MTIAELIEDIRSMDPTRKGLSKLRKAELEALRAEVLEQHAQRRADASAQIGDMTGHWADQGADVDPEDEQMIEDYQTAESGRASAREWYADHRHAVAGAQQTHPTADRQRDAVGRAITRAAARMAEAVPSLVSAFDKVTHQAARAVAEVAWGNRTATVRSMGQEVVGKVVDVVLRDPGPRGDGRVCLVIEHPHPYRPQQRTRTLHHMNDVVFTPLAS